MAQVAIREYDAKTLFSQFTNTPYQGYLIESETDFSCIDSSIPAWIIKPDQLFGKRWKHGLIGVNLDSEGVYNWWQEKNSMEITIDEKTGVLSTFLVEPFISHDDEYYVAIQTERDHDVMYFSRQWGVDIEQNWDKVQQFRLDIDRNGKVKTQEYCEHFDIDTSIAQFLSQLYSFFVAYGLVYLEVNPFVFDADGNITCLDMVARVDSCEAYRQKSHWKNLTFFNPFWVQRTEAEKYIDMLDSQTGASLKFRVLNPDGRIWLITSGWGASVIIADTLADLGFTHEIGNYGEASGNPDRENTKAYADTLIRTMLANKIDGQYIIIAGAIANFTHIDKTFAGIIDAITDHADALVRQNTRILVRRGGTNDTIWLEMMRRACDDLGIPCVIATGNDYMTNILNHITL